MEIKLDPTKLTFKVDPKKILQNLFDFNWGSALTEMIDVSSSKEASAFALLFNVTHRTNIYLAKEISQEAVDHSSIIDNYYLEFELKDFLKTKIVITKDFFYNHLQFSSTYLVQSYKLFEKYAEKLGIILPDSFQYHYYGIYRHFLIEEYADLDKNYKKLVDFFDNPLADGSDTFLKQINHYAEIEKNYTVKLQSGVEESSESLKDLYIAPYFKIFDHNLKYDCESDFELPNPKIDINTFLNDFVLNNFLPDYLRDKYNMIFILGQPGQGKTSLCYKLIYDVLTKSNGLPDRPLFFIKIRDLHAKDFVNDTFNTLKKAVQQNINFESDKCLLVLDGLDEAYMSGGLTDNDLKNLYERLNKTSRNNKDLKIILTSRLNYLDINDPSLEGSLVIKIEVLETQQIQEYINKFAQFYPDNHLVKKIDEILEDYKFKHIRELLEQPVLMYFIALSNINIEENDSKAKIYNKIFDSLAKRSWDKNGQLKYIRSDLQTNDKKYNKYLRQYIRSIAFEIYQSPHLHITVKQLLSLEATKNFMERCFNDSMIDDADAIKDISKYLLISFYFQSSTSNQDGDSAIEFFHNSLWEYLTAEFIWEEYKRVILIRDEDQDFLPVRLEQYFETLRFLVGNKEIKSEVRKNLENIILFEDKSVAQNVFDQSKEVFYKLLQHDMLLHYDAKTEKLSAKDKMQNSFELAWTLLYWNIFQTDTRVETNHEFNEFFFGFRSSFWSGYSIKNIDFLDSFFHEIYLSNCKIENSTFFYEEGIDFISLYRCDINDSIFKYDYLINALHNNQLSNVTFERINFSGDFQIKENVFNNVTMINVSVPDETWLNKIISNNSVDEKFISSHKILTEKGDNDKAYYYITNII